MKRLTPDQKSIILGGLLGDLHIQKNRESSSGNCRLRFSHGAKGLEYLKWKYKFFKEDFCGNTKGIIRSVREKTGYITYEFYTERRGEFLEIYNKWYQPLNEGSKKAIKTVPFDFLQHFTDPLALLVWYLDDGTKRKDAASCRIATQSFTKVENLILQSCLLENFGIRSKIEEWGRSKKTGRIQYQIAILSSRKGNGDYEKFRDLLYPLVKTEIPSMLYKLL